MEMGEMALKLLGREGRGWFFMTKRERERERKHQLEKEKKKKKSKNLEVFVILVYTVFYNSERKLNLWLAGFHHHQKEEQKSSQMCMCR